MAEKIERQQHLLEEKSPGFAELEKQFEDTTKSYENMKKEIVGTILISLFQLSFNTRKKVM